MTEQTPSSPDKNVFTDGSGKDWPTWLFDDQTSRDVIQNPKLKKISGRIAGLPSNLEREKLRDYYEMIDTWDLEDKVPEDEATYLLERLSKRMETLDERGAVDINELYRRMLDDEDEAVRDASYGELSGKIRKAESSHIIDRHSIQVDIQSILKHSTWEDGPDNFYHRIIEKGQARERAMSSDKGYVDGGYAGLYRALYGAAADSASAQGAQRRLLGEDGLVPPDDVSGWLGEKMGSMSEGERIYERRQQVVERKAMTLMGYPPDIDLAKFVGTDYIPSGDADYMAARYDTSGFTSSQLGALEELNRGMAGRYEQKNNMALQGILAEMAQSGRSVRMTELENMNEQQQHARVRDILHRLENSPADWRTNQLMGEYLVRLENSIDMLKSEEMKKEVRARLSVYDMSRLMRRANGWIDPNAQGDVNIIGAITNANIANHIIEREEVEFFLLGDFRDKDNKLATKEKETTEQKGKRGGKSKDLVWYFNEKGTELELSRGIALAWDFLETINSKHYPKVIEHLENEGVLEGGQKIKGQGKNDIVNFFQDTKVNKKDPRADGIERRKQVKKWVLGQIAGIGKEKDLRDKLISEGMSEEGVAKELEARMDYAEKCIQLAESMAISTLQVSRWNTQTNGGRLFHNDENYGGNDQLAECLYFRNWRHGRKRRDRGPEFSIQEIPGWGDSWLGIEGNCTEAVDIAAFDREEDRNRGPHAMFTRYLEQDGEYTGKEGMTAYSITKLLRYYKLKSLLTTESFKPGEINIEWLRKHNVFFTASTASLSDERQDKIDLRAWFSAHVWEFATGDEGQKMGWDKVMKDDLIKLLTRQDLYSVLDFDETVDEDEGPPTFVTSDQMGKIDRLINGRLGIREMWADFQQRGREGTRKSLR